MTEQADWGYVHPLQSVTFIQNRANKKLRILDAQMREIGSTSAANFPVIRVAFSDRHIALAEGVEGVRVIDFSGRVVSSYCPQDRDPNCINLAFCEDRLHVVDDWGAANICIIDPLTGRLLSEYQRPQGNICFMDHGSRYVDNDGNIYRSSDGQIVAAIAAPT